MIMQLKNAVTLIMVSCWAMLTACALEGTYINTYALVTATLVSTMVWVMVNKG